MFSRLERRLFQSITANKLSILVDFVRELRVLDVSTSDGEAIIKKWLDFIYTGIVFSGDAQKRQKFIELSVSRLTPLENATTMALLWIYTVDQEGRDDWYPQLIKGILQTYEQKPHEREQFLAILTSKPMPESLKQNLVLSGVLENHENI